MKTRPRKAAARPTASARSSEILTALRDARKQAVKTAKMHKTPVVYLRAGAIVRERV